MKHTDRWILAVFITLLIALFTTFVSSLSFPDSNYNFTGKTKRAKLDSGKPVIQTFVAKENNLDQVRVNVGNNSLYFGEKLTFELADSNCDHVIKKDVKTFFSPKIQSATAFSFDAIPDSQGKLYCVKITYMSDENRGDDRPYIAANDGPQFANDSYTNTSDGKVFIGRSLQMRPSYGTTETLGLFKELNNRLSQYKPHFFKSDALTTIVAIFLVGTLVLVVCVTIL